MIAGALCSTVLVLGVAGGLARPVLGRFRLSGPESVVACAALSLLAAFALAWAVFVSDCPLAGYVAIPALAFAFLIWDRRRTADLLGDPASRDLIAGQLLVTGWCLGWLFFIRNHSGGLWAADNFEHWERALYFLRGWPDSRLFIAAYPLTARPPLANVLAAVFMRACGDDYALFQVVMAVTASLAFLPAGLLAQRFGGPRAARVAAVLVMVSPMFVQNATYPWTKLQAAFFILCAIAFFLKVRGREGGTGAGVLCALCLGAGILAHYSAGPYAVVLAAAWVALLRERPRRPGFAGATGAAALAGALVLLPWFAWAVARFGWRGTFLSNTSVATLHAWKGSHLLKVALNLRDTLLPPQVRGYDDGLLTQTSPWGRLRDQAFLLYQLNLPLALGSVGWLVAAREALRAARAAAPRDARFWTLLCAALVVACVAVFGERDHYGLAHICLQALVLLMLAFVASRWEGLGRGWRAALIAGCAIDFALGIALQFAVEDFALDRWLAPGLSQHDAGMTYNVASRLSLDAKNVAHLSYFADAQAVPPALAVALLGALLCVALARARRAPARAAEQ
jgi:hypothetical protein